MEPLSRARIFVSGKVQVRFISCVQKHTFHPACVRRCVLHHLARLHTAQGVYYRDTTKRKGDMLALSGAAYNLADGRVEIIAEGSKQNIEDLVRWCWKGPEGAAEVGVTHKLTKRRKVTRVDVLWELEEVVGQMPQYQGFKNSGTKK